jgi:hypothetical protein
MKAKAMGLVMVAALCQSQFSQANSGYYTPVIKGIASHQRIAVESCEDDCSTEFLTENIKKQRIFHHLYRGLEWNKKTRKADLPYVRSTFYFTGGKSNKGRDCLIKISHAYDVKRNRAYNLSSSMAIHSMPLLDLLKASVSTDVYGNGKRVKKEDKTKLEIGYTEGKAIIKRGHLSISDNGIQTQIYDGYRLCAVTKEDWLGKESCKKLGKLEEETQTCSFK